MKRSNLFHGFLLLFLAGILFSCAQERGNEVPDRETTVEELTGQLRAYNKNIGVIVPADDETRGTSGLTLTTRDKIKIAIADVKGGLRGAAVGGVAGAVVGAAVQSLIKASKLYMMKWLTATLKNNYCSGLVFGNGVMSFTDSIGYYHNMLEAGMYIQDSLSHQKGTGTLVRKANSMMRSTSRGYTLSGVLTADRLDRMATMAQTINAIDDEDMSFDEYCMRLKGMHTADAPYIDFAAEYLYAVFYGNVDLREYTEQVFFMINNSNTEVEDARLLNYCIQIAHASVVYANNTEVESNR